MQCGASLEQISRTHILSKNHLVVGKYEFPLFRDVIKLKSLVLKLYSDIGLCHLDVEVSCTLGSLT